MPADGERQLPSLGSRGEGWVAGQAILLVGVLVVGLVGPPWPPGLRSSFFVLGLVVGAVAIGLLVVALLSLGHGVTPFPVPTARSELTREGPYRYVRHPMYAAGLVFAIGWSLATSPVAFIPGTALGVFFDLKAQREEAWLHERYRAYEAYQRRVPWRFVPGLR